MKHRPLPEDGVPGGDIRVELEVDNSEKRMGFSVSMLSIYLLQWQSRRNKKYRMYPSANFLGKGCQLSVATALLLCLSHFLPAVFGADDPKPANPDASASARAILRIFHDLERRTDKRILSGQFSDFGEGANTRIMEKTHEKTGHWPGFIGVDYADFAKGKLTYEVPNKVAIAYAKNGGLVTVSAHLYNPANPNGGGLRDKGIDINSLLEPGTDVHRRWMEEMDFLALGLTELRDAGVVVLWRPFHEMNGNWFWWGAQQPDAFIKVWRHMFEYFSVEKKLDNLVWVYAPNHGQNTAKYYPGDSFTDIVGLDAYTDFIDPQHIKGYDAVAALPKPFGFTEFGPHGPQNPPGDYDYLRLIDGIQKHFPRTCFFKSWNGRWSLASNKNTKALLDHPQIANREDLGNLGPRLK